jgi:ATP-dependent phosphoenolpyruvate carboxykinase
VANPSVSALYEDALVYETGTAMTSTGALTAYSGAKTGRSPLDKRVVKEESSEKDVWWGPVNKAMTPDVSSHVITAENACRGRFPAFSTKQALGVSRNCPQPHQL